MTMWLLIVAIGLAAIGLMALVGLRGPTLTLAAAAIAFGGAGYALTGRPGLPAASRVAADRAPPLPLDEARRRLMGNFNVADRWLIIADSFERRGNTQDAVSLLRSAVRAHPRDYQLWVGLGNALADHARSYSPAAAYAFDRAERIAPRHPAPKFFRGLALVRSGRLDEGAAQWRMALAQSPPDASWRPMIEDALATVAPSAQETPRDAD